MKIEKVKKVFVIICVFLVVAFLISTVSNAVTAADVEKFNATTHNATGIGAAQTIIGMVLDVVRLVGASVAVIMLMTVAAKYMVASSGDRADIKKYALNYVIGAVILFAATGILTVIRDTITK